MIKHESDAFKSVVRLAAQLAPGEVDVLKYRLSLLAVRELERVFEISSDAHKRARLYSILQCLPGIQQFGARVPAYGIAYRGRPAFMTDELLAALQTEAVLFRKAARLNFEQMISRMHTAGSTTVCEQLAGSSLLQQAVTAHAGPCTPSFVTSYIYYDSPGHCSGPHVDNAFTAITAMIGLRHESPLSQHSSRSVSYWPGLQRLDYQLKAGEMVVFFGSCVLHGRTATLAGETVHSLLLSFRPLTP